MEYSLDFALFTRWSAYTTVVFAMLAIASFLFKWGIRFRLVGVTGFMIVLTGGLFGLSLGLFNHRVIPGAVRYSLVYDNGSSLAVVTVKPEDIDASDESTVDATLRQASEDLFSYGRIGVGGDQFTVRLRTIIHPDTGVSEPLYLGQVRRSIATRDSGKFDIDIYQKNLKKLASFASIS